MILFYYINFLLIILLYKYAQYLIDYYYNFNYQQSGWSYLGNDTDSGVIPVSVYSGSQDGYLGADAIEISW